MTQPVLDFTAATIARDQAIQRVTQHAEDACPDFLERACAHVTAYLATHGPTSSEDLSIHCKTAGIVPHDDRAFGAVYRTLARRGVIVRVGEAVRRRGHLTAGGSVWDLVR